MEQQDVSAYGGAVLRLLAIFALIFAATLVTPHLAKFVDKLAGRNGSDNNNNISEGNNSDGRDPADDERKDDNL